MGTEASKKVLKGLSFTASPGEQVALIGATGCGKSTSFQLIQRCYNPDEGQVLLDGRPIQDYDAGHFRQSMSIVAQDSTLFSTTLRENITYGVPKSEREKIEDSVIIDACRK